MINKPHNLDLENAAISEAIAHDRDFNMLYTTDAAFKRLRHAHRVLIQTILTEMGIPKRLLGGDQ